MTLPVNHFAVGIFLNLLLIYGIAARPEYGPYYPGMDIPQYILDETDTMDDIYTDMKKYPENNPGFQANWPYLRERLTPNDFDDDIASNFEEKYERIAVPENIPTPLPLKKNPPVKNSLKDHGKKKNVHSPRPRYYMSPCHFKICNMGRKRNARFERN